jgi:hypothetical protein
MGMVQGASDFTHNLHGFGYAELTFSRRRV